MKLSLAILTKNEIQGLTALFDHIPFDAVDEAFAVDGGSIDGTLEFYRARHFPVVRQRSAGRGEAFHLAVAHATGDAIVFFSPDGNEDPAVISQFRPLLEAGFDLVIASRMIAGARNEEDDALVPLRKWANKGLNFLANVTWNRGPFISDSINGFRAITRKAWDRLAPDATGYTIEYQTSIRAMKLGLRVTEFPTREGNRLGPGGSPALASGVRFLRLYVTELLTGTRFGGPQAGSAP